MLVLISIFMGLVFRVATLTGAFEDIGFDGVWRKP